MAFVDDLAALVRDWAIVHDPVTTVIYAEVKGPRPEQPYVMVGKPFAVVALFTDVTATGTRTTFRATVPLTGFGDCSDFFANLDGFRWDPDTVANTDLADLTVEEIMSLDLGGFQVNEAIESRGKADLIVRYTTTRTREVVAAETVEVDGDASPIPDFVIEIT